MSFNVKKIGDSFKINYIGGIPKAININKLPSKTNLQTLDYIYNGQPFVNIVSRFQDARKLDTIYNNQPFYGHSDGYSVV